MRRPLASIALFFLPFACGPEVVPEPPDTTPPVTTASIASGLVLGDASVLLTTNEPADVTWTVDGSDPLTSDTSVTRASPVAVTLSAPSQVRVRFFSTDASGNREQPRLEAYTVLDVLRPASVAGRVRFHESLRDGTGAVLLFDHDPQESGWEGPIGFDTFAASADGTTEWGFENLPAGDYWAVAAWWPGVPTGDPQMFAAARANPITLDPAEPGRERADFVDLYLGLCDPDGQGIDGVLHLPESRAQEPFIVGALPGPLTFSGAPEAVGWSLTPRGTERPFALCDLPPGDLWIYALAGGGGDPQVIVSMLNNPNPADPVLHQDIWVDVQRDTLGSVTGEVSLNKAAPGATLTYALLAEQVGGVSEIVMLERATLGESLVVPYAFESVGSGTWYVAASVTPPGASEPSGVGFALAPAYVNLSASKHPVANVVITLP